MSTSPAAVSSSTAAQYLTTALGGAVPLAYGRVRAQGNNAILYEDANKNRTAFYLLAEGEWDGIDRLWINSKRVDPTNAAIVHFHPGVDGTLGAGLAATSTGGDQKADAFFANIPGAGSAGGLQPLGFSRRAYIVVSVPPDPGSPTAQLTVLGDYRTTKVRQFDINGNQTAYSFSTNPAWCILDALFRFVLKREALINAAVTAAEKTRINWASFYNAAQYYAFDITLGAPNGPIPRFDMNVAFAQQITVAALFEQMLLMCRSYLVEQAGVIYLFPDQPRASTFTLTSDHYYPGTLQFNKKAVRASANHFVGSYNDVNVPIIANVLPNDSTGAVRSANVVTVTTEANHPFQVGDSVGYFDADDPTFDGDFSVTAVPSPTTLQWAQAGINATTGHGFLGMNEQLYAQRSTIDDHQQHQFAVGQRGAGMSVMARQIELDLDYGNNTGECVRRLLWFQKVRTLGPDTTPYIAPWQITLKARADSVDGNGNALIAQLRGDLLTLDHSVSEELAGTVWEIIEMDFTPAAGQTNDPAQQSVTTAAKKLYIASSMYNSQEAGLIDLTLQQYEPTAFTDVVGAGFALVSLSGNRTGGGLKSNGGPANSNYQIVFDAANAQVTAHDAGTSVTITVPQLHASIPGVSPNPDWTGGTVVNAAYVTEYYLYIQDPDLRGGPAPIQATTDRNLAASTPGNIFIDSIKTPAPGAADTVGTHGPGGGGPTNIFTLVNSFIAAALQTFSAGTYSVDIGPLTINPSFGLKAGDHMTISPVGTPSAGWNQVTFYCYASADNTYHMVILNPGGGALALASQLFIVKFYHPQ